MDVNARDLYEIPKEAQEAIDNARKQAQLARIELARLKAAGQDTADDERQLAAMEAQLAMFVEHFGPGSARRWAQKARKGEL